MDFATHIRSVYLTYCELVALDGAEPPTPAEFVALLDAMLQGDAPAADSDCLH